MDKNDLEIISNILDIKKDILELSNSIDKKCLEIYELNESSEKKTKQYKLMMENLILEYHNVCKNLFENK
jgi:hypothetical protein